MSIWSEARPGVSAIANDGAEVRTNEILTPPPTGGGGGGAQDMKPPAPAPYVDITGGRDARVRAFLQANPSRARPRLGTPGSWGLRASQTNPSAGSVAITSATPRVVNVAPAPPSGPLTPAGGFNAANPLRPGGG